TDVKPDGGRRGIGTTLARADLSAIAPEPLDSAGTTLTGCPAAFPNRRQTRRQPLDHRPDLPLSRFIAPPPADASGASYGDHTIGCKVAQDVILRHRITTLHLHTP